MPVISIFKNKPQFPAKASLVEALEETFPVWQEVVAYALSAVDGTREEWHHSNQGWNYRIKGKKSVIIYLMPCEGHFIASFVLGRKASELALSSAISQEIKDIIRNAKVFAEGRGFRIMVTSGEMTADIKKLIDLKLMSKK